MDGTLFRVLLTSAVYCTEDAFSNAARLKVMQTMTEIEFLMSLT